MSKWRHPAPSKDLIPMPAGKLWLSVADLAQNYFDRNTLLHWGPPKELIPRGHHVPLLSPCIYRAPNFLTPLLALLVHMTSNVISLVDKER